MPLEQVSVPQHWLELVQWPPLLVQLTPSVQVPELPQVSVPQH